MTPFVGLIVFFVLLFSGVWGSMVLSARLKRSSPQLGSRPDDSGIEELREEIHQLGARFERIEEEFSFLRELYKPETPIQLPPHDPPDS